MTTHAAPTEVLTITEAREMLSSRAAASWSKGIEAEVTFCGPNRRPDLAIIPTELYRLIAPFLDDLILQERVAERILADNTEPGLSIVEFEREFGVTAESAARDAVQYEEDLRLTDQTLA